MSEQPDRRELLKRIREVLKLQDQRIPISYDEQCQLFDDIKKYRQITGEPYVR